MNVHYFLLIERFNQMHRYLHLVQSALAEEQERFFANIQEIENEDREFVIDAIYDELVEVRDEFPRMTYSSFIVAWFTQIEHELIKLCDRKDLSIRVKIRDQERFGTGIQRAYTFLKEGASYGIPDLYWQELIIIRKIRNIIVHNDGRIKTYPLNPSNDQKTIGVNIGEDDDEHIVHLQIDKDLYQYLEERAMTDYLRTFYISPTFEYCLELINFGKSLFSTIYEDLSYK